MPETFQYREPTPYSKRMLQTYARHVAHTTPHPSDPARKVVGVKIYRVVHRILDPLEMARGADPADESLYLPYYQGEFDTDGQLKDPNDPYLYWLIPILRDESSSRGRKAGGPVPNDLQHAGQLWDFLQVHAAIEARPEDINPVPFQELPEPR